MVASLVMNTGRAIPSVGLGVYKTTPGAETQDAVVTALRAGYRHVDTAQRYANEEDVGRAIAASGIPREEIFITSKLWIANWGYDTAVKCVKESLERLQTPYIDLMLLHAPGEASTRAETWRALEDLHFQGLLRDIGVSSFGVPHLEKLKLTARVKPAVNQIELHPWLQRREVVAYCKQEGILLEAYSPLARSTKLDDPTLLEVSKRVGATCGQVLVAYSLAHGFVTLPKSVKESRQKENLLGATVELSPKDIEMLDSLDSYVVTGWDPIANAEV